MKTQKLSLADFCGNAKGARKAFIEVVKHLEKHAVPQIAPQWIERALAALQGKSTPRDAGEAIALAIHREGERWRRRKKLNKKKA